MCWTLFKLNENTEGLQLFEQNTYDDENSSSLFKMTFGAAHSISSQAKEEEIRNQVISKVISRYMYNMFCILFISLMVYYLDDCNVKSISLRLIFTHLTLYKLVLILRWKFNIDTAYMIIVSVYGKKSTAKPPARKHNRGTPTSYAHPHNVENSCGFGINSRAVHGTKQIFEHSFL